MNAYEQWTYITTCKEGCKIYKHTDGRVKNCEHNAYRRWQIEEFFKEKSRDTRSRELVTEIFSIMRPVRVMMG